MGARTGSAMLRVAVPNKGALSEAAHEILAESGYRRRRDPKQLRLVDAANDVELFFLRPRDIAVYVGSGTLDVGITGRDLMIDSGAPARELLALGFARSTFRFAAPADADLRSTADLAGTRIAAAYPGLVRTWLDERSIQADVVGLDGAVESAVQLGIADVIADVVETGTTLRQAGLQVFGEPLLRVGGGAGRAGRRRGAPGCRRPGPPPHRRDDRPPVRPHRLRRAQRATSRPRPPSPRAWSRRPSPRCGTPAGPPYGRWSRAPTPTG